jgi:hypothetical protein
LQAPNSIQSCYALPLGFDITCIEQETC